MIKDRTTLYETKSWRETRKQVFWQAAINDQRSKLKIDVNGTEVEGLVDTSTDATMISPKSRHPAWPLKKVNVQLLGLEFYLR